MENDKEPKNVQGSQWPMALTFIVFILVTGAVCVTTLITR